jgi:hypothetical protein
MHTVRYEADKSAVFPHNVLIFVLMILTVNSYYLPKRN